MPDDAQPEFLVTRAVVERIARVTHARVACLVTFVQTYVRQRMARVAGDLLMSVKPESMHLYP